MLTLQDIFLTGKKTSLVEKIITRHKYIFDHLKQDGCYVYGAGRLGQFTKEQLQKNSIKFNGFVQTGGNWEGGIASPDILKTDDIIVIASYYVSEISEQLSERKIYNFIYYEELATALEDFEIYYPAFAGIYEECIKNDEAYTKIYEMLDDNISRKIFENLIQYRLSLDINFTREAFKLSSQYGKQDLDEVVLNNLTSDFSFFDVGGFDGQSTLDFISSVNAAYNRIFFFEPDPCIIQEVADKLKQYKNISFIEAGAGKEKGIAMYEALTNGGGTISDSGNTSIKIIPLDEYIDVKKAYIKMDIEGAEADALCGAKRLISENHPILSVSVYHKTGDIHKLINQVFSYWKQYKLYIRHYSKTYADTRAYFIPY